jgi:hypothetical protein
MTLKLFGDATSLLNVLPGSSAIESVLGIQPPWWKSSWGIAAIIGGEALMFILFGITGSLVGVLGLATYIYLS